MLKLKILLVALFILFLVGCTEYRVRSVGVGVRPVHHSVRIYRRPSCHRRIIITPRRRRTIHHRTYRQCSYGHSRRSHRNRRR